MLEQHNKNKDLVLAVILHVILLCNFDNASNKNASRHLRSFSHLKMVEKTVHFEVSCIFPAGAAPLLAESCISATGIATGRGHGSKLIILDDHLDLQFVFIAVVMHDLPTKGSISQCCRVIIPVAKSKR